MRISLLVASKLALLATLVTVSASAAEDAPVDAPPPVPAKPRLFHVGISGGVAYQTVRVPMVIPTAYAAATLGLHAGYNVTDRLSIGFEVSTIEKNMGRGGPFQSFDPGLAPQAGCNNCEPPPFGGWVKNTTAVFGTLGPRIEFSPFGKDGLYLGAAAGLAFLWGVDSTYGFGGAGRVGYRVRIADILGLAVEGGAQAQAFGSGAYTTAPYGMVYFRPYF
ncbi:hypothetical protein [Polyangium jinanense]|uniref:Outer membrane protein beta-barrel domain-containing protein n=1 Tax=Polyangium jinanense TaxID=2829994 RepID=A0A9X3X0H4_9BACT|nr:hypothetical protein [Polyangium jinanense]MDC3953698.1 hypothetical protein [Polyangium jinanense]MDC3979181.1 hypothetical protein [Polyangium jinanense]